MLRKAIPSAVVSDNIIKTLPELVGAVIAGRLVINRRMVNGCSDASSPLCPQNERTEQEIGKSQSLFCTVGCVVQLRESDHRDPDYARDGERINDLDLVNAGFA